MREACERAMQEIQKAPPVDAARAREVRKAQEQIQKLLEARGKRGKAD